MVEIADAPCTLEDGGADAADAAAEIERYRRVRRVFLITLGFNLLVAVAKAGYGLLSGSVSVGSDAVHSFLDGASNVLALVGLTFSAAPADRGHPYGHRKIEILAALGIGVLILAGMFEMGRAALLGLAGRREPPDIGWGGFVIVLGTMGVNAAVSRYEHAAARRLGSRLLHADAEHTRSDFFGSAAVLASFVAVRAGWPRADSIAALFVLVMVGRVAWNVFRENVPALLDAVAVDPSGVSATAAAVPGVAGVHRVRSRGLRGAVQLDMHVQVSPEMPVAQAHELAHRVETELRARHPDIVDVVIHIEPAVAAARSAAETATETATTMGTKA